MKNADGTVKNALDMNKSLMAGKKYKKKKSKSY